MRSVALALFGTFIAADSESAHFWCHKGEDGLCDTSKKDNFSEEGMRDFVHRVTSMPRPASSSQRVDASTLRNKVIAGYQGWAGARSTWDHWSKDGKVPDPSRKNEHFEMVPQVRELPSGALHDTQFKHKGDGSVVKLYENAHEGVVDKHFEWMKEYGLDGVFIQRFVSEVRSPGKALTQRNTILEQVDVAAEKHGRAYAMMWDKSGLKSSWDTDIKNDWNNYVKKYTSNRQYLKENGKPVVVIFGIGFTGHGSTPSASLSLIHWLQNQGLYVIGSGPFYWRTNGHDAGSGFDNVHKAFDAIMPWAVGRYNTVKDFNGKISQIHGDAALTSSRGQGYAPIAYAGYSYRASNKFNFIKRNAGQFFQAQIDSHLKTKGVSFYYIAMWDEVQEGTAIYKFASNEAESASGREFVTASSDGVSCPGDFYLTMAGQFAARAHGAPAPSPGPAPHPAPSPTPSGQDTIAAGEILRSGETLVSSGGGSQLNMQGDGNLVLVSGTSVVWASGTNGHSGAELRFQGSDGNLVIYAGSSALWSTGSKRGATSLRLQDDCDLVMKDASGSVLWRLGTSCNGVVVTV